MSGTKAGGTKAAKQNYSRYGKDFYKRIGAMGGKLGKTGGFASTSVGRDGLTGKERAAAAGRAGGLLSRRGPWTKEQRDNFEAKRDQSLTT